MRGRSDVNGPRLTCSFCGTDQERARKLIAGPHVFVCDQCIGIADQVIATGEAAATPLAEVEAVGAGNATAECSFCGKRRDQVAGLAAARPPAAPASICVECLALCQEILVGELA